MARVAVFQGGSVNPAQGTNARLQPQDYGPGIGAGMERFGEAGQEAAQILNYTGALHDEAAAKEAANSVNEWYAGAAYTGPNALFGKLGKDALETAPLVTEGLKNAIANARKGLQNPRQQSMFDDAMRPQSIDWNTQIGRHVLEQTRTYAANEATARAGMTAEMAGLTYLDDPNQGEQHLTTMRDEIAKAGRLQGWGPDQIAEKQFSATSSIYKDVGTSIAASGPQGWDLARSFVKAHEGSMSDDARAAVLTRADAEQRSYEAEQRRIEAEQRRLESEQRRDARDRVESGLVRIDQGLPLSTDEYASIHADAVASGDSSLLKRVEEGQFKNNLTIEHAHDTPTQLQDRINVLSATIAKAGAKADPKQILERDHLQQMFNQSNAQLNADSLSWGAAHLGIQLQPLNLNDNASIANRVAAAAQIAKRTGHSPHVLTPAEVQSLAPQWARGTLEQKVALVSNLAKFGPAAGDAAQQLAPNDNGLVNLIGLATHRNAGVGASRVNQILTGYEAIKTKPKLVDKDQSIQQFNQFTGNALQFLPGVKDGVYTNAKALLAAQANDNGWDNWSQVGRGWYSAVNSALGAYEKNGVQYGGLANFNGVPTILPENMSQTDFESRISRATGPQFRAAQNGVPQYGNGQHPTATDLKKMQWVPSGEGVYRLSDGHSFLHTESGGFYEIDISKLPSSLDTQLAAHGYVRR
jgi:hypothetical protein